MPVWLQRDQRAKIKSQTDHCALSSDLLPSALSAFLAVKNFHGFVLLLRSLSSPSAYSAYSAVKTSRSISSFVIFCVPLRQYPLRRLLSRILMALFKSCRGYFLENTPVIDCRKFMSVLELQHESAALKEQERAELALWLLVRF